MKKRFMLIIALGLSFAPPVFALGQNPKGVDEARAIACEKMAIKNIPSGQPVSQPVRSKVNAESAAGTSVDH